MKKCPFCGEEIQDMAKKCRHCGEWLGKEKVSKINRKFSELKKDLISLFTKPFWIRFFSFREKTSGFMFLLIILLISLLGGLIVYISSSWILIGSINSILSIVLLILFFANIFNRMNSFNFEPITKRFILIAILLVFVGESVLTGGELSNPVSPTALVIFVFIFANGNKTIIGQEEIIQIIINKNSLGKEIRVNGNKVFIDKNSKIGDVITLKGGGIKGENGGKNGDLFYVIVGIKDDKKPKGEDEIIKICIEKYELGKDIKYEGNKVYFHKDAKIGDTCVIKGKGYESDLGGENGDLIYVIKKIE